MRSKEIVFGSLITLGFFATAGESFKTAALASKLDPSENISHADILTGSSMTARELEVSSDIGGVGFLILGAAAGASTILLGIRDRQVTNHLNQSNPSKE